MEMTKTAVIIDCDNKSVNKAKKLIIESGNNSESIANG